MFKFAKAKKDILDRSTNFHQDVEKTLNAFTAADILNAQFKFVCVCVCVFVLYCSKEGMFQWKDLTCLVSLVFEYKIKNWSPFSSVSFLNLTILDHTPKKNKLSISIKNNNKISK